MNELASPMNELAPQGGPALPTAAPAITRLSASWQDWLTTNVMRGCADGDMTRVMVENGFDPLFSQHAVSIVRSMTASTFRNATSTEAFQEAFEGRLHALASAHTLLTRSNWRGAGLRELVEEELAAYQPAREKDLRVSGPELVLTPAAALALGMVLHELATNAAKYGSLSRPGGQVAVAWDIAGDSGPGQLRLHWAESGGPRVEPPVRRGFGSTVIERSLAYQLGGTVELAFRPEGVHCRIELPLTDTIAKLPSADPERPTA